MIRENAKELNRYAWVIDTVLNEYAIKRIVIPEGKITEIADVVYKANEVLGYDATMTAYSYPAYEGDTHREFIQGVSGGGGGDEDTLGTLTVTSVAGATAGTTALTVTPEKSASNLYKYKVASEATTVTYDEDVHFWDTWDGESDIEATTDFVITVVEATADYKARKVGSATVVTE